MVYLLFILCIILGIIFPKSKFVSIIISLFIVLSVGFRCGGYDYKNYQDDYTFIEILGKFDYPGWVLIIKLCKFFNLKFEAFCVLMSIISVSILNIAISRLTDKVSFSISCFMMYPFFLDAVQMRVFLIDALILLAISCFVDNNRKSKIFGLCICLFCVGIHILSIYYVAAIIIVLLLGSKEKLTVSSFVKPYKKFYFTGSRLIISYKAKTIMIYILMIFALVCLFFVDLATIFYTITGNAKYKSYTESNMGNGFIVGILFTTFIVFLFSQLRYSFPEYGVKNNTEVIKYKFIFDFGDTAIFMLPLFSINIIMNRLWRVYILLLYILLGEKMKEMNFKNKVFAIVITTIVLASLFLFENGLKVVDFMEYNSVL